MVDIRFAQAAPGDVAELVEHMRAQDVAEVRACGYGDLAEAVQSSINCSTLAVTVRVNDRLACIFGLAPDNLLAPHNGAPWMLGTGLVPRYAATLSRQSRRYIQRMLEICPVLKNVVHAKNTVSVRWLKSVGFTVSPEAFAIGDEPFHVFEMRSACAPPSF